MCLQETYEDWRKEPDGNKIFVLEHLTQWKPALGAGIAQWLERRTRDWKVAGSNPCSERRENFLL